MDLDGDDQSLTINISNDSEGLIIRYPIVERARHLSRKDRTTHLADVFYNSSRPQHNPFVSDHSLLLEECQCLGNGSECDMVHEPEIAQLRHWTSERPP